MNDQKPKEEDIEDKVKNNLCITSCFLYNYFRRKKIQMEYINIKINMMSMLINMGILKLNGVGQIKNKKFSFK